MKILTFTMEYADKKWAIYLEEIFGKEIASQLLVESHQKAKTHEAKISLLNFNNDKNLILKVKELGNITSAYIAEGKSVKLIK